MHDDERHGWVTLAEALKFAQGIADLVTRRGDMTRKEEQEVGKAIDDLNESASPVPKPD